jgi:hypothetical protein
MKISMAIISSIGVNLFLFGISPPANQTRDRLHAPAAGPPYLTPERPHTHSA